MGNGHIVLDIWSINTSRKWSSLGLHATIFRFIHTCHTCLPMCLDIKATGITCLAYLIAIISHLHIVACVPTCAMEVAVQTDVTDGVRWCEVVLDDYSRGVLLDWVVFLISGALVRHVMTEVTEWFVNCNDRKTLEILLRLRRIFLNPRCIAIAF